MINVKGQEQEARDKNMARLHHSVKSNFRLALRYGETTVLDEIISMQDRVGNARRWTAERTNSTLLR